MRRSQTGDNHLKPQFHIQPNIGLDSETRRAVVEILNTNLADEVVLAMKTRSAGWHVRGPGSIDLRALFHKQFRQLNKMSDLIAERVCALGGFTASSFEEILRTARLEEQPGEAPEIMSLLADHEASIRFLREDTRRCFEDYEDHATFAMLVQCIQWHEKMAWILRAWVEPETHPDNMQGSRASFAPR